MIQPVFDLAFFVEQFPLDRWGKKCDPSGGSCASLACREQIRWKLDERGVGGLKVPVDSFVMGLGEAPHRAGTKVGGVPYRPRDRPWPVGDTGRPMTFLGQFCFCESRDVVGETPGDVLLIFARENYLDQRVPSDLAFEWYPLGIDNLLSAAETPKPGWTFVTAHGFRHRTIDYVDLVPFEQIVEFVGPPTDPDYSRFYQVLFSQLNGWKIGGVPHVYSLAARPEQDLPGKFLCSITSLGGGFEVPYPWVNRPAALTRISEAPEVLTMADGFILNLSLRGDGTVVWAIQYP